MKYVGKQNALAFAILTVFASSSAYAVVDLSTASTALSYAKEFKFDDTTTQEFVANTTDQDITGKVGTGLGTSKDYFVRFTLSSGEWGSTGISGMTTDLGGGAGVGTPYLVDANTGIVVGLTTGTVAGTSNNTVTMSFVPGQVVFKSTATRKISGDVKVIMTLHETQTAANSNTSPLSTLTGTYATFSKSIFDVSVGTKPADMLIDVKKGSKEFVVPTPVPPGTGDKFMPICSFQVNESTDARILSGALANASSTMDAAASGSVLKIKGNFAAATGANAVYLTTGTCTATAPTADSTTVEIGGVMNSAKTEVAFTIGNLTALDLVQESTSGSGPVTACMIVDGTTIIPNGSFSVSYEPVAETKFTVSPLTADGSCAVLTKNGSTASVPLVLNSASTWKQFMRITNPSTLSGNVLITAIDDKGTRGSKTYTFPLAAGASTGLISIQNILDGTGAAFLTEAATVGVGALNKLRLEIEAEFGSGHNGQNTDGVTVRTYVLPDANHGTFTQFQ